jgi:hypothetical protein|eukprot:COSAG02_NODE_337_length_24268_cov_7.498738_6_plen_142_part_00
MRACVVVVRYMRQGESYVDLASSFKITTDSDSDALEAAIQRYTAIIFAGGKPGTINSTDVAASAVGSLHVTVTDPSEDLGLETCENYTIRCGRATSLHGLVALRATRIVFATPMCSCLADPSHGHGDTASWVACSASRALI